MLLLGVGFKFVDGVDAAPSAAVNKPTLNNVKTVRVERRQKLNIKNPVEDARQ